MTQGDRGPQQNKALAKRWRQKSKARKWGFGCGRVLTQRSRRDLRRKIPIENGGLGRWDVLAEELTAGRWERRACLLFGVPRSAMAVKAARGNFKFQI